MTPVQKKLNELRKLIRANTKDGILKIDESKMTEDEYFKKVQELRIDIRKLELDGDTT